jgi:hypothetical protein
MGEINLNQHMLKLDESVQDAYEYLVYVGDQKPDCEILTQMMTDILDNYMTVKLNTIKNELETLKLLPGNGA